MYQRFHKPLWMISLAMAVMLLSANIVKNAEAADENVPKVPFKYSLGYQSYQKMCSACHGKWGNGSKQGPPLMHPFYKPSHHPDAAFYRAVLKGVKEHHWNFGDMPPVSGATQKDMDAVIPYIRWLQREKGIYK